jgi:hypothetical protein
MSARRPRPVTWLLYLYPHAWRERYADEVAALLEQYPATFATWLSLVLGALDARFDPYFRTLERRPIMLRMRSAEIVIFCAFVAFVVAGIGFAQMTNTTAIRAIPSPDGYAYMAVVLSAYAALLAVLVGGLPILGSVVCHTLRPRQPRTLLLLAVPILALAAVAGYTLLLEYVLVSGRTTPPDSLPDSFNDLGGNPGLLSWMAVLLLAAIISAAAIARVVSRSLLSPRLLRFALAPAFMAALAMAVASVAAVVWGIASGPAPVPTHPYENSILLLHTPPGGLASSR